MSKKNDFDNFDEHAKGYRDEHSKQTKLIGIESSYFADFKIKQLANDEKSNVNKRLKILDYGCGDGIAESFFAKYFPNAHIVGLDVSEESIEIARAKKFSNAEYKVFDGRDIPLESGTFDIIFVAMVLHHINHKLHDAILNELLRVLAPGGRIYIFEHNPFNPVTRYFINTCPFDKDAHLLNPVSLKNKLKKRGFSNVRNSYLFFLPRFKSLTPFFFIENHLRWLGLGGQYYSRATRD